MQKGKWFDKLNQVVVPYEKRADAAKWHGGPIYRLTHAFTCRGLWEADPRYGGIDQWAVDMFRSGSMIDGAGSDHDIFVVVYDETGKPMVGKGVLFFTNPCEAWASTNPDAITIQDKRDTRSDGSATVPIFQSYAPDRGEHGAWSCAPLGQADVLAGIGMPLNEHISTYAVFQAEVASIEPVLTNSLTFRQQLIVAQASGTRTPATIRKRVEELLALDKLMGG